MSPSTWRPLRPRQVEGSREPRPIKESLEPLAARLGAPDATSMAAVFAGWEEAVGDAVAAHCRPVSLVRATLLVEVDDPAWATQVRYLGATIVERLAAHAGAAVVTGIEVRVRRG